MRVSPLYQLFDHAAAQVALVFLSIVCLLGFSGVSADNTQYLLPALKSLKPELFVNDWFIQNTQSFHPAFERYALFFMQHDQLLLGLFMWYCVNAAMLAIATWLICRYLFQLVSLRLLAASLLCCVLVFTAVQTGWGQYSILGPQAVPHYFAYPFLLISLVALYKRNFVLGFTSVALCFVVHHGQGVLALILAAWQLVFLYPFERREWYKLGLVTVALALLIVPVVLGVNATDGVNSEIFKVFYYARAPHHYSVMHASPEVHVTSLLMLIVALFSFLSIPYQPTRRFLLGLLFAISVGFLAGYVFLEVWYQPKLVRLFPYRLVPVLLLFIYATLVSQILNVKSGTSLKIQAALFALAMLAAKQSIWVSLLFFLAALCVYSLRATGTVLPANVTRSAPILCGLMAFVFVTSNLVDRPPRGPNYRYSSPMVSADGVDIRAVVPRDSVVMIPPDFVGFRLVTQRAIVVNFKVFPVFGTEMQEWNERMRDLTGVDYSDARLFLKDRIFAARRYSIGYRTLPMGTLLSTARKYGAEYVLAAKNSVFSARAKQNNLEPVWKSSDYSLFKVAES